MTIPTACEQRLKDSGHVRDTVAMVANLICDNGSCTCRTGAQEREIAERIVALLAKQGQSDER